MSVDTIRAKVLRNTGFYIAGFAATAFVANPILFARFAFRGREALFTLFAAGMMFPFAVAVLPLVVLSKPTWQTLPLGVTQFQGEYSTETAKVLAFVMLAMLPALVFYAFAKRHLISGLTSGGTKG